MNKNLKGILYGSLASASYGTNPLFAMPLYMAGFGVNSVLFYRYFFAVVMYYIFIKFFKKKSLKISKSEIFPLFILGILFSLSSVTLFESFRYIDMGIACTILFIYPIIVAVIMAIFFKEKIASTVILSIVLTSIGIILLYKGKPDTTISKYGIIMVLLSALMYAIYIVAVRNMKAIKHINHTKLSFYVMFFGLFIYIINLKFCTQLQVITTPKLWIYPLLLALFPTIISIETINIAIKLIGSTLTAILGALEPLTAILFGAVIYHQQLTLRIISGVVLILSGVLLIVINNKK